MKNKFPEWNDIDISDPIDENSSFKRTEEEKRGRTSRLSMRKSEDSPKSENRPKTKIKDVQLERKSKRLFDFFRNRQGSLCDSHGITSFTDGGLKTTDGEVIFFRVAPVNLSVLPEDAAESRIRMLSLLLEAEPNLEMICLDAVENVKENRLFLEERIKEEKNESVRALLKKDLAFFDSVDRESNEGRGLAPSRDFFFLLLLQKNKSSKQDRAGRAERILSFAKTAEGCGLRVRPAEAREVVDAVTRYFGINPMDKRIAAENGENSSPLSVPDPSISDLDMVPNLNISTDHFQLGSTYRCVWAVKGYPPSTAAQGLLSGLGEKECVTVHVYTRPVSGTERARLIRNAERRNKFLSSSLKLQDAVSGEENIKDLTSLLQDSRKENGTLLYVSAFLELRSDSMDGLKDLMSSVSTELSRCRMEADRLFLRQKEGFQSVIPGGRDCFSGEFEHVMPAVSAANLYPFRYSGKTDPHGLYIGRDKYGTNLLVDTDRRDGDKTNGNVLILGNSGQGKSYLLKLMITNAREAGKNVICVDPEGEYKDLTEALGGVYADLTEGEIRINPLEVRVWSDDVRNNDGPDVPASYMEQDRLAAHIAFLKDFFRTARDYTDDQTDVIEMLLWKIYKKSAENGGRTPTLADLYHCAEEEYESCKGNRGVRRTIESSQTGEGLLTEDILQDICLSLRSLCVGAESRSFNGQTEMYSAPFVCIGLKGIHSCSRRLKDAILFNLFSYIHHRLIADGNTVAAIDELYLFLTNPVVLDYLRSAMKRVRKKDSALWLSSQNIEDFLLPGIREYTAPLFSIPAHRFLFYPGTVSASAFTDMLQLDFSAFERIRIPERGTCLYCCGNEQYFLQVCAPDYKASLFGSLGGR